MENQKQLILIDGSSFLFRAYYAPHTEFTTKTGIPTGATLIFTRMLNKILNQYQGHKIIVVFDAKGGSFRKEIYKEYKSNRPPMPDDLRVQLEYVHKVVKAYNLPLIMVEGVEADDVLGSYAKKASALGLKTIICTSDKDLAQLVDDKVCLYDSMKDVYLDEKGVFDKFGVPPKLIVDYLALKGDSSDNIPGMKGVGDVKACALLNSLGGVFEILARKDEIKNLSFRGAKTFANEYEKEFDKVKLSYKLATIKTDVELPLAIEDLKLNPINYDELINLFTELEFKKLVEQIQKTQSSNKSNTNSSNKAEHNFNNAVSTVEQDKPKASKNINNCSCNFICVDSEAKLQDMCQSLSEAKIFAFATHCNETKPQDAVLVGISFCANNNCAYYIPLRHNGSDALFSVQLDIKLVLSYLVKLFASDVKKVGFDIKHDLLVLSYLGIEVNNVYFDSKICAYLLDNNQDLNLKSLAKDFLNYSMLELSDFTGKGARALDFSQLDLLCALNYACELALVYFLLYTKLQQQLSNSPMQELFTSMEMPLVRVLFAMEKKGALLDKNKLAALNKLFSQKLQTLEEQIFKLCSQEFNIASPKQLGIVLFEELKIKYPKKLKTTGTQSYSTSDDILELIVDEHEIVPLVRAHRALAKLISTYTSKLSSMISNHTGRLHTTFNQTGTATGRLSSSDPNLQNIPARSTDGLMIREAFVAAENYSLVSIDYSQIELRLMAHIANDQNLISAFANGKDIHALTAAKILNKDISEVSDIERSHAKATNFGLMYGMGVRALAAQTKMTQTEAKTYIDTYFGLHPAILNYMQQIVDFAKANGYVETIKKHRVNFKQINSTNRGVAEAQKRAAINAPMQGSAADIIKIAMIRVYDYLQSLEDKQAAFMLLQVHDELIFEIKDEYLDEICKNIVDIMEHVLELKVPLKVSVSRSKYWQ